MMDKKFFITTTDKTSIVITFKNLLLEFWAEIKTMWFTGCSIIPSWITFTTHLLRRYFSPSLAFRSSHKTVSSLLPILCHAFSGAVNSICRSRKGYFTDRTGLYYSRGIPIFIHWISRTIESVFAPFTSSNSPFGFRRAMTRVYSHILKMATIATIFTKMTLIRFTTVKAKSLISMSHILAHFRAINTLRYLRQNYDKSFIALRAVIGNCATSPVRIEGSGTGFAPFLVTFGITKMMVPLGLLKSSPEFLATSITNNLYHISNYIISYEVSQ